MNVPARLIRLPAVCDKTGLPRSGVYKRMREDSTFPRRVNLGGRAVAWVESEVDAWVETRIEQRETGQADETAGAAA